MGSGELRKGEEDGQREEETEAGSGERVTVVTLRERVKTRKEEGKIHT